MTDSEILKKAIEKAIASGWNYKEIYCNWLIEDFLKGKLKLNDNHINDYDGMVNINEIIFNRNFAKVFWGDIQINEEDENGNVISYFTFSDVSPEVRYDWEAHLQKMVLEKEPLKYLERFLDED